MLSDVCILFRKQFYLYYHIASVRLTVFCFKITSVCGMGFGALSFLPRDYIEPTVNK